MRLIIALTLATLLAACGGSSPPAPPSQPRDYSTVYQDKSGECWKFVKAVPPSDKDTTETVAPCPATTVKRDRPGQPDPKK